jgi:hypothetical protein
MELVVRDEKRYLWLKVLAAVILIAIVASVVVLLGR